MEFNFSLDLRHRLSLSLRLVRGKKFFVSNARRLVILNFFFPIHSENYALYITFFLYEIVSCIPVSFLCLFFLNMNFNLFTIDKEGLHTTKFQKIWKNYWMFFHTRICMFTKNWRNLYSASVKKKIEHFVSWWYFIGWRWNKI